MTEQERLNWISDQVIGAGIAVHRALGPGLLESPYESCLAFELGHRGLAFERQKPLPLTYRGVDIDCSYRLDLVVEDAVIVEVKSVERLSHIHTAQMISYLRISKRKLGLVINFNVERLIDGVRRVVNEFPE